MLRSCFSPLFQCSKHLYNVREDLNSRDKTSLKWLPVGPTTTDSEMTTCGYWKEIILNEKYEMLTLIACHDARCIHN